MKTKTRKFHPKPVIRQINARLAKGDTLDSILTDMAPGYGVSSETLYGRLRNYGARLTKQIVVPGESEAA